MSRSFLLICFVLLSYGAKRPRRWSCCPVVMPEGRRVPDSGRIFTISVHNCITWQVPSTFVFLCTYVQYIHSSIYIFRCTLLYLEYSTCGIYSSTYVPALYQCISPYLLLYIICIAFYIKYSIYYTYVEYSSSLGAVHLPHIIML